MKNVSGQKIDPMQLEFNPENLIVRLDRMKSVLGQGQIVNQKKLQQSMMCEDTIEMSKKFHEQLASKHMKELAQADRRLKNQQA